jgi:hypothetical protein
MASGIKFSSAPYDYGIMAQEVMRISSDGSIGIGISSLSNKLDSWSEWCEVQKLAETNPAVKIALDKLMTVYYLSKNYGDKI